jgi:predicted nucleotidyltransferase/DNA-binding XRE family transcriptional regulator
MDRPADIGQELVALRRARGVTQEELADRLGVKRQQVQRWEAAAYASTSLQRVSRVAEALGWNATEEYAAEQPAAYFLRTDRVTPVRDLGDLVVRIRAVAPRLHDEFGVTRIGVFGSFARGEQRPDSDVDLLIDVAEPSRRALLGPERALEERLARHVESGPLSSLRPRIRSRVLEELVDVWRA